MESLCLSSKTTVDLLTLSLLGNLPGKPKRGLLVADVNSSRVSRSPGFTGEPQVLSESSFHVPITDIRLKTVYLITLLETFWFTYVT